MDQQFKSKIDEIVAQMIDFMPDANYEEADVQRCRYLLFLFQDKIVNAQDKQAAISIVLKTILDLNKLNESCDYCLIETGEREGICDAMVELTQQLGFNDEGIDITEEWRDW